MRGRHNDEEFGWRSGGRHSMGDFGMDTDFGSWRMRFGRKGFLRPLVLKIVEEKPMTGAEIMDRMQELSMGWWRPSPGSIYPLLDQLVSESVLEKLKDGKYEMRKEYRQRYEISDDVEGVISSIESNISYLEDMSQKDSDKLSNYGSRLKKISDRLSGLVGK